MRIVIGILLAMALGAVGVRQAAAEDYVEKRIQTEEHHYTVETVPAPVIEKRTTVETVPAPVIEKRTTVETVPAPPVIEQHTTVETIPGAPAVIQRRTETVETKD